MDFYWEFTQGDFILILVAVVAVVLFILFKKLLAKFSAVEGIDKQFYKEEWNKIEELASYGKEMNLKLAIIEADKLLDSVLKKMYFPGKTMAERLKSASFKYSGVRRVFWAHKVRNHIVHDVHYVIKHGEARKVLGLFRKAFKELKVF